MQSGIREQVGVGDQVFSFRLCRKKERYGDVTVDHWWMQITELYRQRLHRGRQGGNYDALTRAFWALCCREGSQTERDVQESYLLARLLPHGRSQGSRRIVADANVAPRTAVGRNAQAVAVEQLDEFLRAPGLEQLTALEFSRRTADVLGPPMLSDEVKEAYLRLCDELFGPAIAVVAEDEIAGFATLLAKWQQLMRSVGRRGGNVLQKQLLDILSYEARAALHRCYSAVWHYLLLPHLTNKYALNAESERFLRLWHLDQVNESDLGDQALFHLFHGHIFALHPAAALFLATPTGGQLVGTWLSDGGSQPAFERFLGGMYVAVFQYDNLRQAQIENRKKRPHEGGGQELRDLEERRAARRHRRRRRPPDPD
jgi:hypothetical protein